MTGDEQLQHLRAGWILARSDIYLINDRTTINADELNGQEVFHYSIPNVQSFGTGCVEQGADVESGKQLITSETLLVSRLNPRKATVCIACAQPITTVASTEFVALKPTNQADIAYLRYTVLSDLFRQQLEARVESVTKSHQRVAPHLIYRFWWCWPPLMEQQAIAAFLDRETAKIDALVAEQERLLVLLEEKRQAVIANAVTKGLDPTVPMRGSGVEWLGHVPAHWSVATTNALKAPASTITYGIVQAGPDIEGGIPYVRTSDMSGTELPLTGYLRTTPEIAAAYERSSIKAGDLVIAIRASIGKTMIVPPELTGGNLTQGTAKIEPGRNMLGNFLCYVLNSVPCQQHFASIAKGTTFKEITLEMLRKLKVPQPSRAEQQLIVEHLAAVLPSIGQLISEAETARGLLHERRAALISAAVTGKLDVRAVAQAAKPALAAE